MSPAEAGLFFARSRLRDRDIVEIGDVGSRSREDGSVDVRDRVAMGRSAPAIVHVHRRSPTPPVVETVDDEAQAIRASSARSRVPMLRFASHRRPFA